MSIYSDRQKGYEEGHNATERPEFVTDEHLEYLDELRESGETNMYGARPYILDEFPDLSEREASAILSYWMKTFSERHSLE